MQIHLKGMTKDEYLSLLNIVNYLMRSLREPLDFEEFQQWDALRDLMMDMMRRVPDMKKRINMTLKSDAATALYIYVDLEKLPPFEGALMAKVFEEMDKQWKARLSMIKGNIMADRALLEGGVR